MATNIKQFLTGIGLVPQSSDPVSPVEGQLQFADGTVRASGLWQYKSLQWQAIGGGGGGLDVFFSEEFESNTASSFTSGNNATFDNGGSLVATLGNETVTPLSDDRSISLTQASGSLNDFIKSGAISLDPKQKGNTVGVSFYYTYDGADDDIVFVAYDNTNSTVLTDSLDTLDATSGATRLSTSFHIPATCASLSYGFQVVSETIGAILVFDDIEISTNPFVSKNLIEMTDWTSFTPVLTGFGTPGAEVGYWRRVGDSMEVRASWEFGSPTGVNAELDIPGGYSIDLAKIESTKLNYLGSGQYVQTSQTNTQANYQAVIFSDKTDASAVYFSVAGTGTAAELDKTDGNGLGVLGQGYTVTFTVPIQGWTSGTEHIVTPAKSNMTDWTAYTPVVQGLGTTTAVDMYYKRVGDSIKIMGTLTAGTVSGVEFQLGLPIVGGTQLTVGSEVGNLWVCGFVERGISSTTDSTLICTGGDAFLNACKDNATIAAETGSSIFASSEVERFTSLLIPIEQWTSDVTFLAAVPVQKVAFLRDVKSSGTDGGTFTSGAWQTRDLNTIEGDSEIVSLSANQFTLQAGKYVIEASAPAWSVNYHKSKIRNITGSSDAILGSSMYTNSGATNCSTIYGTLIVNSPTVFELQHRCSVTGANTGLGVPATFGVDEVFAQVKITKLK